MDHRRRLISQSAAPTSEERAQLELRRDELDRWLVPADRNENERLIAALLASFSGARDPQDARTITKLTATAVSQFPAWIVGTACRRFLEGKAESAGVSDFAPSPPRLAEECRRILEPYAAERGRLIEVLGAHVIRDPNPVDVMKIDRVVADLKAQLATGEDTSETVRLRALNRFVEASDRLQSRERDRLENGIFFPGSVSPQMAEKLRAMGAVFEKPRDPNEGGDNGSDR